MEQKIREIIEGLIGKEKADKLPDSSDAKELIDRIAASISKQLTPERMEKLKALGISLEKAVETLTRKALEAVIAAGKAAERAADRL